MQLEKVHEDMIGKAQMNEENISRIEMENKGLLEKMAALEAEKKDMMKKVATLELESQTKLEKIQLERRALEGI